MYNNLSKLNKKTNYPIKNITVLKIIHQRIDISGNKYRKRCLALLGLKK